MDKLLLSRIKNRIEVEYERLGHDQGWSFLYTPGRTLSADARFLFMGLNPGGGNDSEEAEMTTERGNAYHPDVEDWGRDGKGNTLQRQIVQFYKLLEDKTGHNCRKLMDSTLSANFCPFRSKSWAELKERERTLIFCEDLWQEILGQTRITTIVCMSAIVHHHMSSIICKVGGEVISSLPEEVGWGKVQYHVTRFRLIDREICMICLPHLSRYQIFGRKGSDSQVEDITDLVVKSLNGWTP